MPIRLLHWGLALGIVLNLWVLEEGDPPHRYVGYSAVALVVLRTFIGIWGSGHARFSAFPMRPFVVFNFLKNYRHAPQFPGHNPLASWVYVLMWTLVIALGVSGWMMGLDAFWGEDWIEEVHEFFANGLIVLVGFHMIGLFLDAFVHRRKTYLSMFR